MPKAYATVGTYKFLHLLMFLEVLHPMSGTPRDLHHLRRQSRYRRNIWILGPSLEARRECKLKPVLFYLFHVPTP